MTMSGYSAPLACVMVCVGVYWGMRMYMPSVMRVLMGERNDVNKQKKSQPISFLGLTGWDDFEHE